MSASPMDLGAANARISPLIKLSRWSLLVAGVFWGVHRYNKNFETEDTIRQYNARMKPIWDAEAASKKAKDNRDGMIKLAQDVGVKIPPGY